MFRFVIILKALATYQVNTYMHQVPSTTHVMPKDIDMAEFMN